MLVASLRVCLAVYPSGFGRGQGSHVSMSLVLMEVVMKEMDMWQPYNVSVTAIGQHGQATPMTLELCTSRTGDKCSRLGLCLIWDHHVDTYVSRRGPLLVLPVPCSAYFRFPSPDEMLQSE